MSSLRGQTSRAREQYRDSLRPMREMPSERSDIYENLRRAIQREFVSRCNRNASYSLRSFARHLSVDQSLLSKLLNGKRRFSPQIAKLVSTKLGLKPSQGLDSIVFRAGGISFHTLEDDAFELISQWYHFAILELIKTKSFRPEPGLVARRLGIRVEQVRDACDRLIRLGLIKISGRQWQLVKKNNDWGRLESTSGVRRILQKTLMQKGIEAIDEVPFHLRENNSLTVAINSKRLPEFKQKLEAVRRELSEFFQQEGERDLDQVYQMTIAFFPINGPAGGQS